jgi:hypothetical protein
MKSPMRNRGPEHEVVVSQDGVPIHFDLYAGGLPALVALIGTR